MGVFGRAPRSSRSWITDSLPIFQAKRLSSMNSRNGLSQLLNSWLVGFTIQTWRESCQSSQAKPTSSKPQDRGTFWACLNHHKKSWPWRVTSSSACSTRVYGWTPRPSPTRALAHRRAGGRAPVKTSHATSMQNIHLITVLSKIEKILIKYICTQTLLKKHKYFDICIRFRRVHYLIFTISIVVINIIEYSTV